MDRVGIYNRCSTEEESQRSALTVQAAESREIAKKKGWEIAEQYIESRTGTVAYKRREYQRLLADMERDKFDIVMIKSIDRLMRSARDWYLFLGRLTENNLRLYIYIEGKFYTPDDNLISGIKAILAEDFSRELSRKIKNAHRRRQEKKSGSNITCEMFGWNKVGRDTYELNEKEAEYYRMAFLLAEEGKGFYTISNTLYEMGARGRCGQKISQTQWRKMLYTPRAHGTMVLNQRTFNFDTKKYEEVPESEWVVIEGALPSIVSADYQERVLRILGKRALKGEREGEKKRRIRGKYELSRKLVCNCCHRFYYRTGGTDGEKVIWKCSGFLEGGRKMGCSNIHLKERAVMDTLEKAFREQFPGLFDGEEILLSKVMHLIGRGLDPQREESSYRSQQKEYEKLSAKKDLLMEKLLSSVISDEEFGKYNDEISRKMKALEEGISDIKKRGGPYTGNETRASRIKAAIQEEGLLSRAILKALLLKVNRITVHEDGQLDVAFDRDRLEGLLNMGGEERATALLENYELEVQYISQNR